MKKRGKCKMCGKIRLVYVKGYQVCRECNAKRARMYRNKPGVRERMAKRMKERYWEDPEKFRKYYRSYNKKKYALRSV